MSGEHLFMVSALYDGAEKDGSVENGDGTLEIRFTGAPSLGGKGGATNPEELLLAGLVSCFSTTWAIFIGKLKLPVEKPLVDASAEVVADPAGGYRVSRITLTPHVPEELWRERRDDVKRSLELAEKYCIVSKAVRSGVSEMHVALPAG